MNINSDDPRLTAYALGELSGAERDEVERQVQTSPELQREVEEIRLAADRLQGELAGELVPESPELSEVQLAATVAAKDTAKLQSAHPRRIRLWIPASIAAAAVCVLMAGFMAVDRWGLNSYKTASNELAQRTANNKDQPAVPGTVYCPDEAQSTPPGGPTGYAHYDTSRVRATSTGGEVGGGYAKYGMGKAGRPQSSLRGLHDFAITIYTPGTICVPDDRDFNTEAYDHIVSNPFLAVAREPLSTFSIDVDTASYANVRRFLRGGQLPPKGAVRVEEMVNYFHYDYPQPDGKDPFSVNVEVADCPWQSGHKLVRIGLKGKEIAVDKRPPSNLVFLLDVSGSMDEPNKLPLVKQAMTMLVGKLGENDRVAIATYANGTGLALPSTRCDHKETILAALDRLQAGGSTNGAGGITLAYQVATDADNFIKKGVNRVILCTDGDFNIGVSNDSDLVDMIQKNAKSGVFLSVLGFGMGNLKDSKMEKLADKGNGNYGYIDTINEARKMLVEQMSGTLVTIAKDVKIQVEFNPAKVAAYRLIGYENRMLKKEDFNDDKKDAGEIGAGHTVTALYQVVPVGVKIDLPKVDELKYQPTSKPAAKPADHTAMSDEMLTVKLRYKQPDGDKSDLILHPVANTSQPFNHASTDMRFAASVASLGMLLRDCEYKGEYTLDAVLEVAQSSLGEDKEGYRAEFVELVKLAKKLMKPTVIQQDVK